MNYTHTFVICRKLNIQPGISDGEVWLHYIMAMKVIYWLKNCAIFYGGEFLHFLFSIRSWFVSPGVGNVWFLSLCLFTNLKLDFQPGKGHRRWQDWWGCSGCFSSLELPQTVWVFQALSLCWSPGGTWECYSRPDGWNSAIPWPEEWLRWCWGIPGFQFCS